MAVRMLTATEQIAIVRKVLDDLDAKQKPPYRSEYNWTLVTDSPGFVIRRHELIIEEFLDVIDPGETLHDVAARGK